MSIFSRLFRRSTPTSPPSEPSGVPDTAPENQSAEPIETANPIELSKGLLPEKSKIIPFTEQGFSKETRKETLPGSQPLSGNLSLGRLLVTDVTPQEHEAEYKTAKGGEEIAESALTQPDEASIEAVTSPALQVPQAPQVAEPSEEPVQPKISWREKLKAGLKKTRDRLAKNLRALLRGRKLDDALLEELEELLLTSDVGVAATQALLEDLQARYKQAGDDADAHALLQESLIALLAPLEAPLDVSTHQPYVIMLAGVNGAGKTTSIGKLAHYFQQQGKTVLLAAGDTFRAAAREQLAAWGERNQVTVISQESADPAAVIYDAIQAAKARKIDVVLADTAGRLGTQQHLMDELKKIKRVVGKADETAPHEVLLVLDANTGQNALNQLSAFDEAIGVTGLVLTKLDGSAKGGVIAAIAKTQPRPIRFIGVGEGVDDLRPFEARAFVQALFDDDDASE